MLNTNGTNQNVTSCNLYHLNKYIFYQNTVVVMILIGLQTKIIIYENIDNFLLPSALYVIVHNVKGNKNQ